MTSTRSIYKYLTLLILLVVVLSIQSNVANADSTIVVQPGDVGVSWTENDTRTGGDCEFVIGPSTPPLGSGSLQMTTTHTQGGSSQAKAQLFNYDYIGTPLADIDVVTYSVYRHSSSTNSEAQTISLNLEVDHVGDGSGFTTLVFEPTYNPSQGSMLTDTWQQWDAFGGGSAIWWSTKNIPGVCAFDCFVSWSTILANNPNAKVKFGFGLNVGSGWVGEFTGNVDSLSIGINGDTTTYDFESDAEGPITTDVVADPNPLAVGVSGTVTAKVDDTTTGNNKIYAATYEILDESAAVESFGALGAADGDFDSPIEYVTGTITSPTEAGVYDFCVTGTDEPGNTGEPYCAMLVVYDPDGGFVTGGGWIDSPIGAYLQGGPIAISGDTATIEYDIYTGFMYRNIDGVCYPNSSPVTITGTLDVTNLEMDGADLFGLVDKQWIDNANHGYQTGAYLYVGRRGDDLVVGPSDGNAGGEIVQTFATLVDYFAGGNPAPLSVSAEIHAGIVTVTVGGNDYSDDYGSVVATTDWAEFEHGAYIGIDSWPSSNSILYELTYDGCNTFPTGKASFGFVSKYRKGASVPTGNTEFVFNAADLNFHSSSYDWLVVTGNDTAKFKGEGTVNGTNASTGDPYKFQIWAQDGSPDTFRIKIWYDDGGEIVVYDNGMDQPIGGGNIVVHNK